ncbi:MAG: hypothetical protein BCS36_04675 [Desulfovibrio sp. MES5]|nr:MAG: hypothetical protein BCS36_04675 [Desulfovibrio sp. MES5]
MSLGKKNNDGRSAYADRPSFFGSLAMAQTARHCEAIAGAAPAFQACSRLARFIRLARVENNML